MELYLPLWWDCLQIFMLVISIYICGVLVVNARMVWFYLWIGVVFSKFIFFNLDPFLVLRSFMFLHFTIGLMQQRKERFVLLYCQVSLELKFFFQFNIWAFFFFPFFINTFHFNFVTLTRLPVHLLGSYASGVRRLSKPNNKYTLQLTLYNFIYRLINSEFTSYDVQLFGQ